MSSHVSGGEYQSGPGHSRATVAVEDTLLRLGLPVNQIRHNRAQLRSGPSGHAGARPGKPDISYVDPATRQRVNIEIDTDPQVSNAHQRQLRDFDRHSRNIFVVINPRTGRVLHTRIDDPTTNRRRRVAAGPRMSDLVTGAPSTRVRTDPHFTLRGVAQRRPRARSRAAAAR